MAMRSCVSRNAASLRSVPACAQRFYAARPPSRTNRSEPVSSETSAHYPAPPTPSPAPGRAPIRATQRLVRNTAKFFLERAKPEDSVEVPVGLVMSYYDACAGQANAEFEFFHHGASIVARSR